VLAIVGGVGPAKKRGGSEGLPIGLPIGLARGLTGGVFTIPPLMVRATTGTRQDQGLEIGYDPCVGIVLAPTGNLGTTGKTLADAARLNVGEEGAFA